MLKDNEHFYQLMHGYFMEYLIIRRQASRCTVSTYRQSINDFRKYLKDQYNITFSDMDFSSFSKDNVYNFLVYLRDEKHLSVSTLNLRLAAIKSFMRYCSDEDPAITSLYLNLKKINKFKDSEQRSMRIEYLNEEQLKLLFSLPDTDLRQERRNLFIMILLYETGARIEEFLNIRLSDIIRQDTVRIRLHGKGDKVRYIPLLSDVIPYLDAYMAEFHPNCQTSDLLFYTIHQSEHTKMTDGTVNHILKKYAKKAAETDPLFPQDLHCHTMRHSIAMAMYKKGIPLTYIKDFLGHASLNSVAVYAHADDDTIAEALETANADMDIRPVSSEKKWKGHEDDLLKYCGLA